MMEPHLINEISKVLESYIQILNKFEEAIEFNQMAISYMLSSVDLPCNSPLYLSLLRKLTLELRIGG